MSTEFGTIQRELRIDASPEVVFEVVSSPAHLREWWSDDAELASPSPGSAGELSWGDPSSPEAMVASFTVVEAEPPRLFSFRWVYAEGATPEAGNSLLVTFELTPSGTGTMLRMTESGFREMGWEAAVLEEAYNEHAVGWDFHLPRLVEYAARLAARR